MNHTTVQGYSGVTNRATAALGDMSPASKRATEADRLADRMSSTMLALNSMVGRLNRSVDRIVGPSLQGGEGKTEAPAPTGHVITMDMGFNDIEAALTRFRAELERLEAFA